MSLIDMHSHGATTARILCFGLTEEQAQQDILGGQTPRSRTEKEMAADFRRQMCQSSGSWLYEFLPLDEVAELHDYSFDTQREFPELIIGNGFTFNRTQESRR